MVFLRLNLFLLLSFFYNFAFAEYDKVYCGKIKRLTDVSTFNIYTNIDFNYLLDMTETCGYDIQDNITYAGIYAYGDEVIRLEKIINTTKSTTNWCIKARWSGYSPCSFPSGDNNISTRTEFIYRIDRQSAFSASELDL